MDNFGPAWLFGRLKDQAEADEKTYVPPKTRRRKMPVRKSKRSRISLMVVVALLVAFAAGVPAAIAQDSLDDPSAAQYNPAIPPDGGTAGESGGGLDNNIGSLPFTGMDLLIVAGVALVLTGTGFAMRRLSAPPGPRV